MSRWPVCADSGHPCSASTEERRIGAYGGQSLLHYTTPLTMPAVGFAAREEQLRLRGKAVMSADGESVVGGSIGRGFATAPLR